MGKHIFKTDLNFEQVEPGSAEDNVLVRTSEGDVKEVPRSSFGGGGSTPTLQQVITAGGVVTGEGKIIDMNMGPVKTTLAAGLIETSTLSTGKKTGAALTLVETLDDGITYVNGVLRLEYSDTDSGELGKGVSLLEPNLASGITTHYHLPSNNINNKHITLASQSSLPPPSTLDQVVTNDNFVPSKDILMGGTRNHPSVKYTKEGVSFDTFTQLNRSFSMVLKPAYGLSFFGEPNSNGVTYDDQGISFRPPTSLPFGTNTYLKGPKTYGSGTNSSFISLPSKVTGGDFTLATTVNGVKANENGEITIPFGTTPPTPGLDTVLSAGDASDKTITLYGEGNTKKSVIDSHYIAIIDTGSGKQTNIDNHAFYIFEGGQNNTAYQKDGIKVINGTNLIYPLSPGGDKYLPISVNGILANSSGDIETISTIAPTSSTDSGKEKEIRVAGDYIYWYVVGTGWLRAAGSTF